jgi:hypothetical protein
VSDHWVRSPLLNVNRACQTCHHIPEDEILARVDAIQDRNHSLLQRAGGRTDGPARRHRRQGDGAREQACRRWSLQRKAQWRLDFIAAENSMGFHAPQEAARILGEAADYARQGQVAVGLHHGMEDEGFRVQHVEILGQQRASAVALRHLARVPEGAHLASLDLAAVRADVERHPWVAEATVSRALPSTLRIEVREHQPVMLLALDRLWYLDDQGEPFRLADSSDLDYPVLTGFPPELVDQRPELSQAAVQGALRVLASLHDGPLPLDQLSEIHFDERLGYELGDWRRRRRRQRGQHHDQRQPDGVEFVVANTDMQALERTWRRTRSSSATT